MRRDVPLPEDGRCRALVARPEPRAGSGSVEVKRVEGDVLRASADLLADGHYKVSGVLRYRRPGSDVWEEAPLAAVGDDRFEATLLLDRLGLWWLQVEGWIDAFASWRSGLARKAEVQEVEPPDLATGAELLREAASRATGGDRQALLGVAGALADRATSLAERTREALTETTLALASRHPDRRHSGRSEAWPVRVDPPLARCAAWYEFFPRSTGERGQHGTLRTAAGWLPYIAGMGFDVVYLPPIHPIGRAFRKGKNNALAAGPGEPGSPWAIGAPEGGHTAIHPELGTLEDFEHFLGRARDQGLEVALDVAFQASPDHPWVKEHPSWFKHRPDGSIQYAENPPKKYQDVYPFDFESEDWAALWMALRDVFVSWIERGVKIFRVDNPHTKPIAFWTWCIAALKARHPEVTFLAEAFTRPKLMYALARAGFSQGYTYFTWRSTRAELEHYLTELTRTEVAEYFRPSFWPNTPDILPEDLQIGGRAAFLARLVLAATLSSHYGIYGPAFELLEHVARPDSGEYLDNEKYELRQWDRDRPDSLRRVITVVNRIRRDHPALHRNDSLRFHRADNDRLLVYSKAWQEDVVLVAVNLDHQHRQAGWVELDLEALGLEPAATFQVHDLLGGRRYLWRGPRNYLDIDSAAMPAQIFAIRRKVRTEHDFDYFM